MVFLSAVDPDSLGSVLYLPPGSEPEPGVFGSLEPEPEPEPLEKKQEPETLGKKVRSRSR